MIYKAGETMEKDLKICDSEFKLMEVVWDLAPVKSMDVMRECGKRYGWGHSAVFTTITRLSKKGFLKNEHTIITPLVSREEVQKYDCTDFVKLRFKGSISSFLAAFCNVNDISEEDLKEISKCIESMGKKEK